MDSHHIRHMFLDYFIQKDHKRLSSSPLVLPDDQSLLFVNAGMVPFKHTFLGLERQPSQRICSAQKCLRVSGKHNDLEQVGISAQHLTFFEMLGNFSFGAYFKREAMLYAWDLLTQKFHLPVERLWVTVYMDDDVTAQLWEDIGVRRERILRFGAEDNFWSMGDTGPCGPSTEINYYQGSDLGLQKSTGINSDDDDYVEIWNLVFMQYNRDEQGQLIPLQAPSVDTGMGLERIASVLQGVRSIYETDLFVPILQRIGEISAQGEAFYAEKRVATNVIADHSRTIAFLIADGVRPGNIGRSYVLRRIIRRAAYFGRTLDLTQPFLASIVQVTIEQLGAQYPELQTQNSEIYEVVTAEEKRFQRTLTKGLQHLEELIDQMTQQGRSIVSGSEAFKLYDTFGFPLDLTQRILSERGWSVDVAEYDAERQEQQQRSRAHTKFK
jgi:alanyl-tRNA synthetase